ncbi:MAG: TIGR03560 family F420-dependent LLM class oxidoreductase [Anaerolineales bacterium]
MFGGLKKKAQWAEANGFAWFSLMDHLIQIPNVGAEDEPFMEGWSTLSALAAVTSKIRLATLVTSVAYRNPAHLAKIAAGVDIISRGRLTFGIGAGWHMPEYQQYGWKFPEKPAIRIAQMEEAIQIALKMWSELRATFHGKYFHLNEAILEPKPVQKPHPPILIGGSGEQLTLRAVARWADACNLFGDPATFKSKLDVLRGHCDKVGRDFNTIERTNLSLMLIARDETALKAKKERMKLPDPFRGYALTTAQVIDVVGGYQEAGLQMLILHSYKNDVETLELFAADVMPKFR